MRNGPASTGIAVRAGAAGGAAGNWALTASTICRNGEAGIGWPVGAADVVTTGAGASGKRDSVGAGPSAVAGGLSGFGSEAAAVPTRAGGTAAASAPRCGATPVSDRDGAIAGTASATALAGDGASSFTAPSVSARREGAVSAAGAASALRGWVGRGAPLEASRSGSSSCADGAVALDRPACAAPCRSPAIRCTALFGIGDVVGGSMRGAGTGVSSADAVAFGAVSVSSDGRRVSPRATRGAAGGEPSATTDVEAERRESSLGAG